MTPSEKKARRPMAEAVLNAYRNGQEDEAMNPIVLDDENGRPVGRINAGDYVIFYDIRGEREIQLSECLTDPNFAHFEEDEIEAIWMYLRMLEPKTHGSR